MTIYGWIHEGMIPYYKLGRLVRFSERERQEWLNKRKKQGRAWSVVEIAKPTRAPPLNPFYSSMRRRPIMFP
jgi:hypothetical protein